jgi:palmitoyl transferase
MHDLNHRIVAATLTALLAFAAGSLRAQEQQGFCQRWLSWVESNCEGARKAWNGGDGDLYLSGIAYHGRGTYTREKIDSFNEVALGGGIGKRYIDENGRTHLLYAMAFQDSHFKPEYTVGYGWLAHWRPWDGAGLRLGAGFTALITFRTDFGHYTVPVPGILPLAEIGWNRASILATYLPRLSGKEGNGDVLMVFGKISF